MQSSELSLAQSKLKLTLWNAEVESFSSHDFYIWLQEMGLPESVVTRLHEFASKTVQMGKKLVSIGKVLLFRIISFVKENPCLVVGAGIGAVIGAAIYSFMSSLPWSIGQHLEPIAKILGLGTASLGVSVGHSLDRELKSLSQSLQEAASNFFNLLANVLRALSDQFVAA
jgi:hypothetical protein